MATRYTNNSACLLSLCYKVWLLCSDCATTSTFFQFPKLRCEYVNVTFINLFIRLKPHILVTTCKVHREFTGI